MRENNIGKILYGYCNGYFGRDDYAKKIIVFETRLAICCRWIDTEGLYILPSGSDYSKCLDWLVSCRFDTEEEKQKCIDDWSSKERS